MRNLWLLGLAALVGSAACESTGPTALESESSTASPEGSWALQVFDLDGGQSVTVPNPEQYTLDLGADGRANLRVDCNVCNGSYGVQGSDIEFGLMACTRAACPPDSLDDEYLEAISGASAFHIVDGELRIAYSGGVLRFTQR
jgi:heat shock protein HslJ